MKRIFIFLLIITIGCISQQPPHFDKCEPEEPALSVNQGDTIEFSCKASDPDTEDLTYTWYINGEQVSDTYWYDFEMAAGDYTVLVEVSDSYTTITHQWDVTVTGSPDFAKIQTRLERIRGLEFLEPVKRIEISRDQLRENLMAELEEDLTEIHTEKSIYVALHIMDTDDDLYQIYTDMLTAHVASYYGIDEHIFYEVVDPDAPIVYREFVAAHELVHALQDQHHYLDREFTNDDEYLAHLCLVEGDAMFHQYKYLDEMTLSEKRTLFNYVSNLDIPVINAFLENVIMLRYDLGFEFVNQTTLYGEVEGLLDQLYERPPVSTEQVMHVEKYMVNEQPVSVDVPSISGWEERAENVFGEALIMTILGEHIDSEKAAQAAAGWGGDAYKYYEKEGSYLFILNTFWDTEKDAAEFFEAYYDFTVAWSGNNVKKARDNIYETPTGFLALVQKGKQVIIIESPSLEAVTAALSVMRIFCVI